MSAPPQAVRPAHIMALGRLHPQLSPQKDAVQLRAQLRAPRYFSIVSSVLLLDLTTTKFLSPSTGRRALS
jgi:hypothetical protein